MVNETIRILCENEILEAGDILDFNRERVANSRKVRPERVRKRDPDDDFWKCQVTNRTAQTGKVRYLADGREYSLTGLVNHIAAELVDDDVNYKPSEVGYWCHPQYHHENLWNLREKYK